MSIRRTIRFAVLFTPMVLLALVSALPHYSERLSVTFHGYPFARIVQKERLNVFEFVARDNMRSKAVVFWHGKPIGWIYQPMMGLPRFVSFSGPPNVEMGGLDVWFDLRLPVAWLWRWYLVPIQAVVLLVWLRRRAKHLVCHACGSNNVAGT